MSSLAGLDAALRSARPTTPGPEPGARSWQGATVTVVGAGATGLELAAHLAARHDVARVTVLESGPRVGADLPAGARRRLERLLAERGVDVRTGCSVSDLHERTAHCLDGTSVSHDVAVLATGLVAPPLLSALGLGDENGAPVRATLQVVDRDEVYAVGDCAYFLDRPLPCIGVHGVRQGPVLFRSLLARQRGAPLPVYEPQRRALAVLDLGGGVGLAVRGRWWWYGAVALRLKRFIDRRWLASYRGGRFKGMYRNAEGRRVSVGTHDSAASAQNVAEEAEV